MPLSKVDFERMVLKEGRSVTLLRRGSPDITVADIKAKIRRARNDPVNEELTGGMVEDEFMVICTTKELSAASFGDPKSTDRLQFDGEYHLIDAVYHLYRATELVGYRMRVQG